MSLAEAKTALKAWIRKAETLEHENWLRAGLPRGSGLPAIPALAAQIIAMEQRVAEWLKAERQAYADYILAHPPTKEPITKTAMGDLPPEAALTYHHWFEDVVTRGGTEDADARGLEAILHDCLSEGIGQGAIAGRKAAGASDPGFATINQAQAKRLMSAHSLREDATHPEDRALYAALAEKAANPTISGGVLRDGAGRVVGAATWSIGNKVLEISRMGSLDSQCPGVGIQLLRELAGKAAAKGAGLALTCPPLSTKAFTDLGFVRGITKADQTPGNRVVLPADQTANLAAKVPDSPAWASTGFLEGPATVTSGNPWEVDAKALQAEFYKTDWGNPKNWGTEKANMGANYAGDAIGQIIHAKAFADHGQESQAENEKQSLIVARDEQGKLIGTASLYPKSKTQLEVSFIGKDPNSAAGVGRQMIRQAATQAAQNGQGLYVKADPAAAGFYQRMGMTQSGSEDGFPIFKLSAAKTATLASGLTGSVPPIIPTDNTPPVAFGEPVNFTGQVSWELAVSGADDALRNTTIKGVVDQVAASTHQDLLGTMADSLMAGESTDTIAQRITDMDSTFGPVRAQRIARTEVLTANRRGGLQVATDAGVEQKQWMSNVGSPRTRLWHKEANQQIVDIDKPFEVHNSKGMPQKLMVPGDYSMGATGDNTINCRCGVHYIKKDVTAPLGVDQHGTDATTPAPAPLVASTVPEPEVEEPPVVQPAIEPKPEFVVPPKPVAEPEPEEEPEVPDIADPAHLAWIMGGNQPELQAASLDQLRTAVVGQDDASQIAASLLDEIKSAPTKNVDIYRGAQVPDDVLQTYTKGAKIDLGLSSFTTDVDTATEYATGQGVDEEPKALPGGMNKVLMNLHGPAKTLDLTAENPSQMEHVTAGQFEVKEVTQEYGGVHVVTLRQASVDIPKPEVQPEAQPTAVAGPPESARTFDTMKSADTWGKAAYAKPTAIQRKALLGYEESDYATINDILRKDYAPDWDPAMTKSIGHLNTLCEANPLPETVQVVRMLPNTSFTYIKDLKGAQKIVGQTFTDKGFMSTSLDQSFAGSARGGGMGTYPIEMHLTVPAGTPSYYVNALGKSDLPEENELLLASGQTFKVNSATTANGRIVLEAEVLPK